MSTNFPILPKLRRRYESMTSQHLKVLAFKHQEFGRYPQCKIREFNMHLESSGDYDMMCHMNQL